MCRLSFLFLEAPIIALLGVLMPILGEEQSIFLSTKDGSFPQSIFVIKEIILFELTQFVFGKEVLFQQGNSVCIT